MEQLEKVDSTIEQLEYYQHDQCDVLIIRLLLLSLMNGDLRQKPQNLLTVLIC